MTSLAKAALQLLQHILARYQLAIRKRDRVLCGLFTLLDNSLVLAKRSSSFKKALEEAGIYKDIFKEAFSSLRGSLERPLWGSLQHATKDRCREEFQVNFDSIWTSVFRDIWVKIAMDITDKCLEWTVPISLQKFNQPTLTYVSMQWFFFAGSHVEVYALHPPQPPIWNIPVSKATSVSDIWG